VIEFAGMLGGAYVLIRAWSFVKSLIGGSY